MQTDITEALVVHSVTTCITMHHTSMCAASLLVVATSNTAVPAYEASVYLYAGAAVLNAATASKNSVPMHKANASSHQQH